MDKILNILSMVIYSIVIALILLFEVCTAITDPNVVSVSIAMIIVYLVISLIIRTIINYKKTTILFTRTKLGAKIPTREKGNAGFDIYGLIPTENNSHCIIVKPHETKLIPTGIASVIPEGYYIQIEERGSTGSEGIKYSAGVIDSSYRGEWFLATTNTNDKPVIFYDKSWENNIDKHEYRDCILYPLSNAIFQGVIHNTHDYIKTKQISNHTFKKYKTARGEGKLGSSGK
ncbi:hypothetical protein [uncultured Thomasclavelia sp.]|uniref:hypothetical protein n=1 Tax=uncultured Thomasclavelia sp. TaxID=3025759 RepID=UPI00280AB79C|nr:hypothetical protein [uncultured Thomasclavelia sp.]